MSCEEKEKMELLRKELNDLILSEVDYDTILSKSQELDVYINKVMCEMKNN